MKEKVIEVLTTSREKLDELLTGIEDLKAREETLTEKTGRELSLAYTELQKGRMWVGEVLHDVSGKYPYANTNEVKAPEDIAPATDLSKEKTVFIPFKEGNYIEAIANSRKFIDAIVESILNHVSNYYYDTNYNSTKKGIVGFNQKFIKYLNFNNSITYLKQGRMILGTVLGKIRDNATK